VKRLIAQYSTVCLRREGITKKQFRECMMPKLIEGMGRYYVESETVRELDKFIREYQVVSGNFPPNVSGGRRTRKR